MTPNRIGDKEDSSDQAPVSAPYGDTTPAQSAAASESSTQPVRIPAPRCVNCGYNLWGIAWDKQCPECGLPVKQSLRERWHAQPPPEDYQIDEPAYCVRCGGAIGGLRAHGTCPSCGVPIWYSIQGSGLLASDACWLRKVRAGLVIWIGMLATIVVLFTLAVITLIVWVGQGGIGLMPFMGSSRELPSLFSVLVNAIHILPLLQLPAAFLITTRESEELFAWRRLALRITILLFLAFDVMYQIKRPWEASNTGQAGIRMSLLIGSTAGTVAVLGLFVYLRDFVLRIADRSLLTQATWVMWGYGLTLWLVRALHGVEVPVAIVGARLLNVWFMLWLLLFLIGVQDEFGSAVRRIRTESAAGTHDVPGRHGTLQG